MTPGVWCGQGYLTKDRRRPQTREADEALQAALSESEAEDEGSVAADLPGSGGIFLEGLLLEATQFELLMRTLRVLVRTGQAPDAQQLAQHIDGLLSKRSGADKWASYITYTALTKETVRWMFCTAMQRSMAAWSFLLAWGHMPDIQLGNGWRCVTSKTGGGLLGFLQGQKRRSARGAGGGRAGSGRPRSRTRARALGCCALATCGRRVERLRARRGRAGRPAPQPQVLRAPAHEASREPAPGSADCTQPHHHGALMDIKSPAHIIAR
jgi:hypothetical protein